LSRAPGKIVFRYGSIHTFFLAFRGRCNSSPSDSFSLGSFENLSANTSSLGHPLPAIIIVGSMFRQMIVIDLLLAKTIIDKQLQVFCWQRNLLLLAEEDPFSYCRDMNKRSRNAYVHLCFCVLKLPGIRIALYSKKYQRNQYSCMARRETLFASWWKN